MPDPALSAALKQAAGKEMHFAFISKGMDGKLLVRKTPIPPKELDALRKEMGGTVVKGKCSGPPTNMIFMVKGKMPAANVGTALMKHAKKEAGIAINAIFQPLGGDEDDDSDGGVIGAVGEAVGEAVGSIGDAISQAGAAIGAGAALARATRMLNTAVTTVVKAVMPPAIPRLLVSKRHCKSSAMILARSTALTDRILKPPSRNFSKLKGSPPTVSRDPRRKPLSPRRFKVRVPEAAQVRAVVPRPAVVPPLPRATPVLRPRTLPQRRRCPRLTSVPGRSLVRKPLPT